MRSPLPLDLPLRYRSLKSLYALLTVLDVDISTTDATDVTFSEGGFRPVKPRKSKKGQTACSSQTIEPSEDKGSDSDDDADNMASEVTAENAENCKLFACPNEGCVKTYQRYGSMVNHTLYGQCVFQPERESLLDTAKIMYSKKLLGDNNTLMVTTETATVHSASSSNNMLNPGWALRSTKPSKPFSEKQRRFLEEKFKIGETTGRKLDPVTVARQMRVTRGSDGQRLFTPEELLSAKQIQGFFSRKAKSKSRPDVQAKEDFVAAEVEDAMVTVRNEVLAQTQASHPFTFDGHDLCDLVAKKKLSKLTLPVLREMCSHFELEISGQQIPRRKAPYVEMLEKHVRGCSCFDAPTAN